MNVPDLVHRARALVNTPFRRARLKARCEQAAAPMYVPFYHRVADNNPNGWTISRRAFGRQVEHCREYFDPIGLDEVQRRVLSKQSHRPSITFTFDDGYAENCEFAIPLLLEHQIPTVYFVTADFVGNQQAFPHDIQRGAPLAVNTVSQLREMSDAGIEIGLHTRDHCDFSKVHCPHEIRRQIMDGKQDLEQMIGHRVRYFAFPYGLPQQLTQAAIEVVHEAGLQGFCSAYGAYNLPGRDAFHIRRFHGDPQFWRFRNWLSFDEHKVQREPDVRYFLPPSSSYSESIVTATKASHAATH